MGHHTVIELLAINLPGINKDVEKCNITKSVAYELTMLFDKNNSIK